jgi:hypothetical protein
MPCTCFSRREFTGLAAAGLTMLAGCGVQTDTLKTASPSRRRKGATVRAAFIYPPSKTFADNPDGWWSWPGNDFDAEGRQVEYMKALDGMEKRHNMKIPVEPGSIADMNGARRLADQLKKSPPDGLLLVLFYNRSLKVADFLVKTAEQLKIPVVFFIGLGVKHGAVGHYRRPGVYFIQSLDNLDAIEYGMRMINARKLLASSKLLSITPAEKPRTGVEKFLGVTVQVVPFSRYEAEFKSCEITDRERGIMKRLTAGAREVRGLAPNAMKNAIRAHLALEKLIMVEDADGVTMRCLRSGMLKPCISFSMLNNSLIPAACENDLPAAYGQMLGQLLTGRPGFQHNPAFETEKNHYYASHCTCPTKLYGPDGERMKYLLRRFAHTNEGSCAIQVFWKVGDPVTMLHYYPGAKPKLDVYAGRVVKSHEMPPCAGCTTNVEIKVTDRKDACMVKGHHNILFAGDYARKFRLFANLYGIELVGTV